MLGIASKSRILPQRTCKWFKRSSFVRSLRLTSHKVSGLDLMNFGEGKFSRCVACVELITLAGCT